MRHRLAGQAILYFAESRGSGKHTDKDWGLRETLSSVFILEKAKSTYDDVGKGGEEVCGLLSVVGQSQGILAGRREYILAKDTAAEQRNGTADSVGVYSSGRVERIYKVVSREQYRRTRKRERQMRGGFR